MASPDGMDPAAVDAAAPEAAAAAAADLAVLGEQPSPQYSDRMVDEDGLED